MTFKRISVGLLSTLLLISCGKKGQDADAKVKAPAYPTIVVEQQAAELATSYPVTIKGMEDIEVRPRIDGFIKEIYVDEGSVVRKGQTLFKIDSPSSEQALTSGRASVNSAQASVNTAKLNVDRLRPLAEKGIISIVQLQTAENSYQTALAGLLQAQSIVQNAQSMVSWTNVTSPVDGVVGSITYRQGSLVSKDNILTTVANTSNVFAYFSLNEKELMTLLETSEGKTQAEKIKNMPAVTLTLANGSVYEEKGKIGTIAGLVNVNTGSVNFRAEFPNKAGLLRSGTSGRLTIPKTLDNVFVIPQKATTALQDKILVYKVQGDSVVQTIVSAITLPDGQNYAITGGLSKGDRIVIDGIATLSNGAKIEVK